MGHVVKQSGMLYCGNNIMPKMHQFRTAQSMCNRSAGDPLHLGQPGAIDVIYMVF